MCSFKRYVQVLTPIPVNVTFFGNGIFADVVKLKSGHTVLGYTLSPMTGTLGRDRETHRNTQGQYHATTEAGIGVMCLQIKD